MNIKDLTHEVEEVSKIYSKRFDIDRDGNWFVLKLQEEMGELIQSYLMMIRQGRSKGKTAEEIKENFHKEVADVFCHVLLLAKFYKINLENHAHITSLLDKIKPSIVCHVAAPPSVDTHETEKEKSYSTFQASHSLY